MEMEEGNNRGLGQPRQRAARTTTIPRRSGVYEHFTDVQGDGKVWRCKHCREVVGANIEKGTSNLWKHLKKKCKAWDHSSSSLPQPQLQLQPSGSGLGQSLDREPAAAGPEEDEATPQLQPSGSDGPSDHEPAGPEEDEASRDLARMIALHGYDPSVVEDDYFRSFVRRLNPRFELPSRETMEKMCSGIFQDFRRDRYRSNVGDDSGELSVAVGQSKTIETGQVVYVTIHFIDCDWNLHRELDDICMALPVGDHYHVPLRPVPVVSLDDDAVDRIEYAMEYQPFMIAGESTVHISLRNVKGCREKKGFVTNIIYSATYMDHVLHSIARCLLPDSEFVENIFNTIKKVRYGLLLEQAEILTKLGLAKIGLLDDPWEYDERWYSCYCCLVIVGQEFPDDDSECKVLLRTLWRAIYCAIKRVSDSSRPTSNICLQELFNVRDVLISQLSDAPTAVHPGNDYSGFGDKNPADVLREALETVDKAIQDSYLVWSIPLVLDPRYKLRSIKKYFKKAYGSSEADKYVSEVRREIKELYTRCYDEDDDEDLDGSTEMSVDSSAHSEEASDDSNAQDETQLDRYLQDSLVRPRKGFDILKWWKDQGSPQYPTVARMARDALAMPTCSKLNPDQMAQVKSFIRGYHPYL